MGSRYCESGSSELIFEIVSVRVVEGLHEDAGRAPRWRSWDMNSDNTGTTTIILLGHLSVVRSSMLIVPSFHLASFSQS